VRPRLLFFTIDSAASLRSRLLHQAQVGSPRLALSRFGVGLRRQDRATELSTSRRLLQVRRIDAVVSLTEGARSRVPSSARRLVQAGSLDRACLPGAGRVKKGLSWLDRRR